MAENKYNFGLYGGSDSDFNNQIDTSNLVDEKPVYYIRGALNSIYDSSTNAGTFYCINCINVTVKNLDLNKNINGIFFWKTNFSRILNVNISDNGNGISLYSSSSNILTNNNALKNNWFDFVSASNSTDNYVTNLTINPTISFLSKDVAIRSGHSAGKRSCRLPEHRQVYRGNKHQCRLMALPFCKGVVPSLVPERQLCNFY